MALNREILDFIEEVGLIYEKTGLPRMCGRIMGLLMTYPTAEVSFNTCVEELHASKSTVSASLKTLEAMRFIQPYTEPGQRKTLYKLVDESVFNIVEQKLQLLDYFQKMVAKGAQLNPPGGRRNQLDEMADFYAFVLQELPTIRIKWESKKKL